METATLVWGTFVGVAVASAAWPLARFCLQISDEDKWPFGPTWFALATGWTAFLVTIYVAERSLW